MLKRLVFALTLTGVGLAQTDSGVTLETAKYVERDYRFEDGKFFPSWVVCDGERDVAIISRSANTTVSRTARIQSFAKRAPRTVKTATYALGEGDNGMSQTIFPLGETGRQFIRFTPASVYDDARRQPVDLYLDDLETRCGRVIGVRFLGVTSRRSVYVWQEQNGLLHYESFDYRFAKAKQPASTAIIGGTFVKTIDGRVTYSFQKNSITYRVSVNSQPSGASISVLRGKTLLQTEIPLGYADVRDKP